MNVKELIEKLQSANENMEVMLHDGFSVNAVEIESVVQDNNQHLIIITPQEVEEEDLDDNVVLL